MGKHTVGGDTETGPGDDWPWAAPGVGSGQKGNWLLGGDKRPRPSREWTGSGPISALEPHPGSLCPHQTVTSLGLGTESILSTSVVLVRSSSRACVRAQMMFVTWAAGW